MTTLDSDLLESVEKDYFDDPRVMALVNRFRCAQSEPVPVGHLVSPHGEFKPNFNFRFTFPPKSLDWSIPLYHHAPAKPAEPFSSEAISVTQTAWKMGYDACKEEQATQSEPVAATSHVFNPEDPRCIDGGNACTDCMYRDSCLLSEMDCEHKVALMRLKLEVLDKGPVVAQISPNVTSAIEEWKQLGGEIVRNEPTSAQLPPLPKNLHSLAGNIWCSICEWADAEPGAEAGEAAKQINKALDAELLAYAKEALRLNGVNV